MSRKIRYGMVGGGRGAFIGGVHRIAANMDGQIELVCGAFSSSPKKSKASGRDFFLPAKRCYGTFEEMIEREAALPAEERMDFVSIVTPNHMHFPPAKMALENGFHVLSDKPATFSLKEAKALEKLIKKSKRLYGLTHNYTGYPLVKEARHMVATGKLGKIRKVVVEYPQGWLATRLELTGQKQAGWRTDPKGVLHSSQISVGEENNLNIRVYGERGSLEWHQNEPNTMLLKWPDQPMQVYRTGNGYLGAAAANAARTPPSHPEGYLEAFANIYVNFANHIRAKLDGRKLAKDDPALDYPKIKDGIRGMAFIEAVVKSSKNNASWTKPE
jgi:predicted dehydrogenase